MLGASRRTSSLRVGWTPRVVAKAGGVALIGLLAALAVACSDDEQPQPQQQVQQAAAEQPAEDTQAQDQAQQQAQQQAQAETPGTIVDIAVADGRFETLVAAVQAADLVETLQGDGPFTVFAPTDDAFAALPEGTVAALLQDIPALTNILLYHVVAGDVRAADVVSLESAVTVQGESVSISVEGDSVRINGALVVIADIVASNGVVHVIDAVLLPPEPSAQAIQSEQEGQSEQAQQAQQAQADQPGTIVDIAVADGRFETLVAAVQAAGLVETLQGEGPFTVFAPTDEAFAALPEGTVAALLEDIPALTSILLYHVVAGDVRAADVVALDSAVTVQGESVSITVEGDSVRLNDSLVVIADIVASNGVIHVIDAVLLPPEPVGSIVDIALADDRFETLVAALQAADLVGTLQGEGPFTVFAPTDDAFDALPEGTVEALLEDIPTLTAILLYHVVAGDVRAADVVALESAVTVQGEPVSISVEGDNVRINDALVVITDIAASNGVIHVIDAVLLPPEN